MRLPGSHGPAFRPFALRGRRAIVTILCLFTVFSAVSAGLSIRATAGSKHKAAVIEVATRQRMLAVRYVDDVLLVRDNDKADPSDIARILMRSAHALLYGGLAPAVEGDDDGTVVPAATGRTVRRQLMQEERLARDLTTTGRAVLAHRPTDDLPETAGERIVTPDPLQRLRVLSILAANVSLNAARSIARSDDRRIGSLITLQVLLGVGGLVTSLLLAWALIAATRRQSAHFRSLVTASTDLVLVFAGGSCVYASRSVAEMVGVTVDELLGARLAELVHDEDRAQLNGACARGQPHEIVFRLQNRFGEWRQLEAHVTDLRDDRMIRGVVLNARDITERARLQEQLSRQAFHDSLTGLANRALFRDRLDQALARSARSRDPLAVLLVDLDGFKQVNDTLGHDAGDRLLQEVAGRFGATTRQSDTLARLGGDEFALLLENAGEASAVSVAEHLLERLSEPICIADRDLCLNASVGIVLHEGGPAESEALIRDADLAMYEAKETGRGRYAVYNQDMSRKLGELVGLEHEIRIGLREGQFTVHYQPQVSLVTKEIVGVEALLRWHSPTRGLVPPSRFVPVAEATGTIQPLGEFVLREACEQAARWRAAGLLPDGFVVWVNLSGKQLTAGLRVLVQRVLNATGIPPSLLGLEVTESAIVADNPASERAMLDLQRLHEKGVHLAIDDFGTGFSSLAQLRRFPVDLIKLDRSFVQGIEHDARDEAITSHTVNLAHALGLSAIAEGIESDGQLAAIDGLGCDLAQGFLFARPTPADDVTALLEVQPPTNLSAAS